VLAPPSEDLDVKPIDSPRRRRLLAVLSAGALGTLGTRAVFAQAPPPGAWPGKLVRIVVPYTPGTGMDILARTLGPHLQAAWGQSIVVENRPGASGNLGAGAVAKSPPDGLTLLMGVNTLIINPALYSNMTYDPLRDLTPLGLAATGSFLLVASGASHTKLRSVDDVMKVARAKPGALDYASPGIATPHHMAMEQFKQQAKVSITHIPFSGTAGALNAVLSGEVPLMFLPVHVAMAQVRGGRLFALAATGDRRSPLAPDVPTLAELGFKGVEADLWYGMLAPAGTPPEIVARINADMRKALALPEVKNALSAQGMEVAPSSPEEMGALMKKDAARWAAVVKQAGIKGE
jgi:tripartite-type tricarboxylate transporter receptor subunit TctC